MKLLDNATAQTYWKDGDGAEWQVKLYFDRQPKEDPDYQDGVMVYPGCPESVIIADIERLEPLFINGVESGDSWVLWTPHDDDDDITNWEDHDDITKWETEILELIREQTDES